MLPLANTSCLIYGCGLIPDDVRELVAADKTRRLVIAVNGAARATRIAPDVIFHIDPGDWASELPNALEVRPESVEGGGIALRMWLVKPLPMWLNPGRLYHRPNTAVVAALWAMSIGCSMVGMIGCGCEADGRAEHQIHAMKQARDEALARYHDLSLIDSLASWKAFRYEAVTLRNIYDNPAGRLREFYR